MSLDDEIVANEKVIYKIINRFKSFIDVDDLYQVAIVGLMKAYKLYDSTYNVKFMSYAYPFIWGEVLEYVRASRNLKMNKKYFNLYSKVNSAIEILAQRLMHNPSCKEIADFLEIDENLVVDILTFSMETKSLDSSLNGDEFSYYNVLQSNDDIKYFDLYYEIDNLSELEKKIIYLKYFEDFSQKEVGDQLGMYQVDVSRKERKILSKLRNNMMV